MTIVIDSNIVAALVLPVPYTPQAIQQMAHWDNVGEPLIAPVLFEYEIITLIRRSVVSGQLEKDRMPVILAHLLDNRVVTIAPTRSLHQEALRLAERIGQSKAYDAQYLALASRENAPLWTADRRLANAAQAAGLEWVHWIGNWEP